MSCKAAEITPNINNSFGLGTANECTVQWWFKETSLEDEETQWWAIRSWQQPVERIVEADPLTATGEVAEEFSIDPCAIIQHLKQIGKVKKLNKLVLHELTAKKKKSSFWSVIFSYSVQEERNILIRLWPATKSGFYTTGNSLVGVRSSKALHKTKFAPK